MRWPGTLRCWPPAWWLPRGRRRHARWYPISGHPAVAPRANTGGSVSGGGAAASAPRRRRLRRRQRRRRVGGGSEARGAAAAAAATARLRGAISRGLPRREGAASLPGSLTPPPKPPPPSPRAHLSHCSFGPDAFACQVLCRPVTDEAQLAQLHTLPPAALYAAPAIRTPDLHQIPRPSSDSARRRPPASADSSPDGCAELLPFGGRRHRFVAQLAQLSEKLFLHAQPKRVDGAPIQGRELLAAAKAGWNARPPRRLSPPGPVPNRTRERCGPRRPLDSNSVFLPQALRACCAALNAWSDR